MPKVVTIEETRPAGPIAQKHELFSTVEDFTEVCFLGTMNTAKSDALCTDINRSAIEYPGATLFLCRGMLTDLIKTTLDKLLTKYQGLEFHHDKKLSIVYWPEQYGKVSKLVCFGVNTGDYVTKLKSFEPFRIYIDEANEVGEKKLDFMVIRARQKVYHRHSYQRRIQEDIIAGLYRTEDEGLQHYGVSPQELHVHQRGKPYVKYVANDEGNDWVWQRVVNPYGDKPHPPQTLTPEEFEKWAHENVGITEIRIPPAERPRFRVGSLIERPDGVTDEVDEVLSTNGEQVLKTRLGQTLPAYGCTLVLERLAIYGFALENHSASEDNIENFYFVSQDTRKQYLYGLTDVQTGLMHPNFSLDTHVVPHKQIPPEWNVEVYLDYNIDAATATFWAWNPEGDAIIFNDYEGIENTAYGNGFAILNLLGDHPRARVRFYGDPSMWQRSQVDPSRTVAKDYQSAGLRPLSQANNERGEGMEKLKEMLDVRVRMPYFVRRPLLYVMENCELTINGSDRSKGLANMTWELWKKKQQDHLHDTVRYGAATHRANLPLGYTADREQAKPHVWRR